MEHSNCNHHQDHDHAHGHNHHGHHHAPVNFNRAFAIGITLNLVFVIIEAFYGYLTHSLALIADAGHNLSDVVGLILAWVASWLGTRKPSGRFTYGFGQTSILSALLNSVLLLIAVGGIFWEAIDRIRDPGPVSSSVVMTVAAIGIFINGFTAWLFVSGRKADLNIRGAYLHMAADALVSLGVVAAGLVMSYTHWYWIDPVVSIVIGIIIVVGTWGLLRDSFILVLAAVPDGIEMTKLKNFLASIRGVKGLHDLHVWGMSTKDSAMTVHLVMPEGHPGDAFLAQVSNDLEREFKIAHSTIQIEIGDTKDICRLQPNEVV